MDHSFGKSFSDFLVAPGQKKKLTSSNRTRKRVKKSPHRSLHLPDGSTEYTQFEEAIANDANVDISGDLALDEQDEMNEDESTGQVPRPGTMEMSFLEQLVDGIEKACGPVPDIEECK